VVGRDIEPYLTKGLSSRPAIALPHCGAKIELRQMQQRRGGSAAAASFTIIRTSALRGADEITS
jgi:hypothetical protein